MSYKLILHSLRCDKLTHLFGSNEVILEVLTDDKLVAQIKKDIRPGDNWLLSKVYKFTKNAKVRLQDQDNPSWGNPNDLFNELKVINSDINFASAKFTRGADYTLTYTVIADRTSPTAFI